MATSTEGCDNTEQNDPTYTNSKILINNDGSIAHSDYITQSDTIAQSAIAPSDTISPYDTLTPSYTITQSDTIAQSDNIAQSDTIPQSDLVHIPDVPEQEVKEKPIDATHEVGSFSEDQIECVQTSFTNVNGLKLNARIWRPPTEPYYGMVCIIHAYGTHCLRYDAIARSLALRGILAFGHDSVGMGESEGVREPATDFTIYTQDVIQHINTMKDTYPDMPLFMLGESSGSLFMLSCIIEVPNLANGLVILASAIKPAAGFAARMGVKLLNKLAPTVIIYTHDFKEMSRDPDRVIMYENDALQVKNLSARFINTYFSFLNRIRPRLSEIEIPTLIYHGGEDKLAPADSAQLIYDTIQSRDKEIRIWQGCLHSLLHESLPDRQNISNGIIKWILDRAKQQSTY